VEISAVFKNKKSFFAKKVSRETAKAQNSGQNHKDVNRKRQFALSADSSLVCP